SYERRQGLLVFVPRYPLVPGRHYRASFRPDEGRALTVEYRVPPRPATPPAVVDRVYPTASELPANQLKFYIHFSRPMRETRDICNHFHLSGRDGEPVPDPWRRTELWSADGKRLTLWIHPGRIKQGVNLREEFEPVLSPGREYTLVIDDKLLDAD